MGLEDGVLPLRGADIMLTCRQCGKSFVFTEAEQEFFKEKGFTLPRRCKECRTHQTNHAHLICSSCGNEFDQGAPVYCPACLASVELDFELKTRQAQKAADEASTRLEALEAEKAELEEVLGRKEQGLQDLERKVAALSQELEEKRELYTALDRWFQPTLHAMEGRVAERLEVLEQGQNKINERMRQLIERLLKTYENTTLFTLIKRTLRPHQRSSPQAM